MSTGAGAEDVAASVPLTTGEAIGAGILAASVGDALAGTAAIKSAVALASLAVKADAETALGVSAREGEHLFAQFARSVGRVNDDADIEQLIHQLMAPGG